MAKARDEPDTVTGQKDLMPTGEYSLVEKMVACPKCATQLPDGARFCSNCGASLVPGGGQAPSPPVYPRTPGSAIWFKNFYRIRKKVVAIANQYWIEDQDGNSLGYARMKLLKLKDDIRIYSDESMGTEEFMIKQQQTVDMWGTFDIVDTPSGVCVGKLKRRAMSAVGVDEYLILDPAGQRVGRVAESAGRGLTRKYISGGSLVPEHVAVEFYGREVAEIKQKFKVIGDIWEVDCSRIPPQFDRRVLLAAMLLMGMVERDRK